MNSNDLEKWQARKVSESLFRLANYLVRLRQRMEKRGFPHDDELYRLTCTAHDAVCRLSHKAHYLSCSGVHAPASFGAIIPEYGEDDMCGRFVCSKAPEVYGSFYDVVAPAIAPNFNVAPTSQVPVIKIEEAKRVCVLQRWGLIPSWAKDKKMNFINARADTLFEKPAFRAAAKRRRCLILADGYFEWKAITSKQKQPYFIRAKDVDPIAFAGVWETWKGEGDSIDSCAIITTDANELSREIHDRMPVILRGDDAWAWIDPDVEEPKAPAELLKPFPAEKMTCYPVGTAVGNVRNKGKECIEPVAAP